jgi:hypothetical protein
MNRKTYNLDKGENHMPEEKDRYTFKDITIIVFAWLMALSLVYICYLKFTFYLHH